MLFEFKKRRCNNEQTKKTTINKYGAKVGDVFALAKGDRGVCNYYSFFQVIKVTSTKVEIAEIGENSTKNDGFSSEWNVYPAVGDFLSFSQWFKGKTSLKKVSFSEQRKTPCLTFYNGKYHAYKVDSNRSFTNYDYCCD